MKTALWNVLFGVFFLALVFTGMGWLIEEGALTRYVSLGDFLLMALAIFRLIRLTSYDVITKFIRDAVSAAPKGTLVGTFSELIHCPWCTGLWYSFFVVFFFYATPIAWPIVLILALAGVASVFQIFSNFIGWSAEHKKRMVMGTDNHHAGTCG